MAQLKRCSRCDMEKDLDDFHMHNTSKDGRVSKCKSCAIEVSKIWYSENREQVLDRLRGDKSRNNHYKHRFKMTLEEYISMSEQQMNVCANSGCYQEAREQRNGVLVVDHDRMCCPGTNSCGQCVRALLCQGCNKALGLLKEDRSRMEGLIMYLDKYNSLKGGVLP